MGLLRIPDKYNPPGNGKGDMERPIYANKKERGLLMMLGGSGKMTKHGIRSFSYEDSHPGDSYGNRQGGAQSGNTSGASGSRGGYGGGGNSGPGSNRVSSPSVPKVTRPTPVKPAVPVAATPAIPVGMNFGSIPITPAIPSGMNFGSIPTTPSMPSGMNFSPVGNYAGASTAVNQSGTSTAFGGYPGGTVNQTPVSGPPNRVDLNRATLAPWGSAAPQGSSYMQGLTADQLALRAKAVSRGPGSVAGVMPGAGALSQQRTMQTLGGALQDGGFSSMTPAAVNALAKTVYGEAAGQPPMGQTAVANSMLNRLSLAAQDPAKYGYLGGLGIQSLMNQYDATGPIRAGGVPNNAFQSAQPGTDALGQGIASLAGAASPNSQFNTTQPASIRDATSFYNPRTSNPSWGGPQFTALGDHVFGLPDELAGKGSLVADARGVTGTGQPVQVASAAPAAATPVPQTQTETGKSLWQTWAPQAAQDVAAQAQKVLVDMPAEKIAAMGGYKRAGQLAQLAVSIGNFLPGGSGYKGTGSADRQLADGGIQSGGHYSDGENANRNQPAPPPVVPPVVPPAAAANWMYPQYTQAWANLPTGIGGPIWTPKPPADGIFDKPTDSKKKKKHGILA